MKRQKTVRTSSLWTLDWANRLGCVWQSGRGWRGCWQTVAIAVLYFITGELGLLFASLPGGVTAIWPPTGIAAGLLLCWGDRIWPGLILGAVAINSFEVSQALTEDQSGFKLAVVLIGITSAMLLEPFLSATSIRIFIGRTQILNRVEQASQFLLLSALGPLIASVLGTALLIWGGTTPWSVAFLTWWTWFLGGTVSIILFAPLLLAWLEEPPVSSDVSQVSGPSQDSNWGALLSKRLSSKVGAFQGVKGLEFALLGGVILVICLLTFGTSLAIEYLLLPLLIWAVFRFGLPGVMLLVLEITAIAVVGTARGSGHFVQATENESLLLLQTFVGVLTITALMIAAVLQERTVVQQQLAQSKNELERKVAARTNALQEANHYLRQEIVERHRAEAALQQLNLNLENKVQQRTQQLQRALDFEAVLKRVTDRVRDSLDEAQILQATVYELAHALSLECCNSGFYDSSREMVTINYGFSRPGWPMLQGKVIQISQYSGEIHQALFQQKCLQFCRVSKPDKPNATILACPIFDDQGVLGDLWLFKTPDRIFDKTEIRFVRQVANQCAIAIRQARFYQAVQDQVHELERLNQLKDDFLSTVSHELRTPITSMKMALRMLSISLDREIQLAQEFDKPEAQQSSTARYFRILREECDREVNLINDLLDLQRLECAESTAFLEPINLVVWMPQVLSSFESRAQNRQQSFDIQIAPHLPLLVSDPNSLERILIELVTNACKYTPPGGQILCCAQASAHQIQIQVRNSGIEIPDQEQTRIFDKFYRIPKADPWKQGGTGLGLALVKQLVIHLGGSIEVESAENQTCFTLCFALD